MKSKVRGLDSLELALIMKKSEASVKDGNGFRNGNGNGIGIGIGNLK